MADGNGIIGGVTRRKHVGITIRHRVGCPATRDASARCRCSPAYRAGAWIADPAVPGAGRKVERTFADIDSALVWRSQVITQVRRDGGASLRPGGAAPTVREAGDALLAGMESGAVRKRGGGTYRPGVVRAYRHALALRVYPALGGRRIDAVGQIDLLEFVEVLQAAGLAPSSVRNAIDPLRVLFRRAAARGVVSANPTSGLELPSGEKRRDRVADPAEASRLIAALGRSDDRALWACAFYCGLRAGELRALRWRHVDLARGTIAVRENLPVDARSEAETTDPKTAAGARTVPIAPPAHRHLAALRAALCPQEGERVYPASRGGPFARTSVMRRARAAWQTAKLDEIGLHEARHSAASMWIASGLHVKLVSELIGHASIAITLDRYGHLFDTDVDHAAAAFAAYLERADTTRRLEQLDP
jgi:integrase